MTRHSCPTGSSSCRLPTSPRPARPRGERCERTRAICRSVRPIRGCRRRDRARRCSLTVAAGDIRCSCRPTGRGQTEAAVHVSAHAGFEIDRPVVSETGGWRAALRVERDQMIARAGKEARRRGAIARPVRHASATDRCWRRVAPDDFGGLGLERDDIPPGRDVHDAVDHERRDLQSTDTGVERPRRLQSDVGRRDLAPARSAGRLHRDRAAASR